MLYNMRLNKFKNLFKIVMITIILVSCKKESKEKTKLVQSDFNLKTDITSFKKRMTELDTIKIWIDHSACVYEGVERVEITKSKDSLNILTEYKEITFNDKPEWKTVYERKINVNDTIWEIETFFKRNSNRLRSDEKKLGRLQVSHNNIKLHYIISGLNEWHKFLADYSETMIKLYPENKNNIYGMENSEIENTTDEEIYDRVVEVE